MLHNNQWKKLVLQNVKFSSDGESANTGHNSGSIMSSVPVMKSPRRCACALLVSVSVALDSEYTKR